MFKPSNRVLVAAGFVLVLLAFAPAAMRSSPSSPQQTPPPATAAQTTPPPASAGQAPAGRGQGRGGTPNFEAQIQLQAREDQVWRDATAGKLKMEKTNYKSRVGGMDIPVFVFTPLTPGPAKSRPALVWVHPDIRGHVYPYYIPYVIEAVSRGYVVVAPEYRGSEDYGQAHYDAIDYGGAEVDDVLTSVDYIKSTMPHVDPARIGIIGWSHGGMITLLSITREPATFKAAVAMVPVTNLFQRLAWAGVERQHQAIDPQNRYGGLPNEKHDIYVERSPIYQIDKLQIPLLVHVAKNDADVHIEEDMQLVDALRARKPILSETKVYDAPQGGHLFDRQYDRTDTKMYTPTWTREQRDSWNRVWTFLDWNLDPYKK
jgi:dipeptidyl aminopeptidase/acylaminoacyl peptidase